MTGYTDGTFRPETAVTLEEACGALLKLLGYDASSLAGTFPQAQLSKASALGLRDQVGAARGQALTRQDCVYLFYNLLTAQASDGQTYAVKLGYTVTNGQVNYTTVAMDHISGPFVAQNGTALPASVTSVYRNGEPSENAALNAYDVYYYNESAGTAWIYTDRASGKIEALSPSVTDPTSVTVSGNAYPIESSSAAYQLSAMGGSSVGRVVTLLLGMNGGVVEVLTEGEVDTAYLGVVASTERVLDTGNTAQVRNQVSVVCTDGVLRTFTIEKGISSAGHLVAVSVSGGAVTVKGISGKSVSGTVSRDASKLGDLPLAEDIEILDTASDGSVKSMKNTTAVKLASLGVLTVKGDNKTYELADDVQVYLRQNGTFYGSGFSSGPACGSMRISTRSRWTERPWSCPPLSTASSC